MKVQLRLRLSSSQDELGAGYRAAQEIGTGNQGQWTGSEGLGAKRGTRGWECGLEKHSVLPALSKC